ncbi:hypothetical protein ACLOJK_025674 [Asimina triloba]
MYSAPSTDMSFDWLVARGTLMWKAVRTAMVAYKQLPNINDEQEGTDFLDISSIVATIHEKSYEDFMSRHICVNKFMFKAGVGLPFEFDIFEALNAFDMTLIQLMSNSWKILRVITWLEKWMGHRIDQTL